MFGSSAALLTDNMSRILNVAGMAAVGMTAASMLLLAEPGFARDLAADANITTTILPGADAPLVAEKAHLSTAAEAPVDDRKRTRLNSSHYCASRLPSSACNKNL